MITMMMRAVGQVLTVLAATAKAGEFLPPWAAGPTKDYSNNENYAVGVGILTEWDADFTNATITLVQDNKPGDAQGGPFVHVEYAYNKTTWGWTVSYEGMDAAYNNVFYFSVSQANGSDAFTGHYFNISHALASTSARASSTTASQSTASSSSSSSSSSSLTSLSTSSAAVSSSVSTTIPLTTTSGSITGAPASSGGTPLGTIAGVVVGIVGGALLLAVGVWWFWRSKMKKKKQSVTSGTQFLSSSPDTSTNKGKLEPYQGFGYQAHELGGSSGGELIDLQQADSRTIHELHESGGSPRR